MALASTEVERSRTAATYLLIEVLVLGCAGMTQMADRLADDLGIPVVEPCRSALQRASKALSKRNDH